jgi:peptidoglycan/LPS O-acetylase OafA/YrhL
MMTSPISGDAVPVSPAVANSHLPAGQKSGPDAGGYRPQLDGLRAFAVALVFVQHWIHPPGISMWGQLGVNLFFVLSGFLITGILLKIRAPQSGRSSGGQIKAFYVRRFLRIFPVYYATLILLWVGGSLVMRRTAAWQFSYLSNFLMAHQGVGNMEYLAHFWSLAVEEQFYLIWPWVVVFLPARYLEQTLVLAVAVAPIYRGLTGLVGPAWLRGAPITCFDTLGLGALLAYWQWNSARTGQPWNRRVLGRFALVGAIGLMVSLNLRNSGVTTPAFLNQTLMAPFLGWLVIGAADGFAGLPARLLENRAVVYLGKISYGMYIFHMFMPAVLLRLHYALDLPTMIRRDFYFRLPIYFAITVGAAALSWHLLERPINNLKRHFPYEKP